LTLKKICELFLEYVFLYTDYQELIECGGSKNDEKQKFLFTFFMRNHGIATILLWKK